MPLLDALSSAARWMLSGDELGTAVRVLVVCVALGAVLRVCREDEEEGE